MNDNNSELEEIKIDRQLRRHGDVYSRGENSRSARRIAEALVIAALIGLGTTVWLLRDAVNILQTSQAFLQRQVDQVAAETRDNSHKVDEMQGRFYRGLQQGKDIYAPDQQR